MTETVPIPFQITVCGLDELADQASAGVSHVLSILDPGWPEPEVLRNFDIHRRLRLHFHDVIEPLPGWIAPERWDVDLLLAFGRTVAAASSGPAGAHLLVHCHAGVSRSTAAAALILAQAVPERPAHEVFAAIVRIRPRAWPNLRILEFGDDILGRSGDIVAAVPDVYRGVLDRQPQLEEAMIEGGRLREVLAALGPPSA